MTDDALRKECDELTKALAMQILFPGQEYHELFPAPKEKVDRARHLLFKALLRFARQQLEEAAKVAESGACNIWRCPHGECLGHRNAAAAIRQRAKQCDSTAKELEQP